MSDIELLRLAAKALALPMCGEWDCAAEGRGIIIGHGNGDLRPWNPLSDDGEAFRILIDLGITIRRGVGIVTADYLFFNPDTIDEYKVICQMVLDDYRLAARHAIVRAAAEIGSSMP